MRRRLLILLGALLAFGAGVAVGCTQSAGTSVAWKPEAPPIWTWSPMPGLTPVR